MKRLLVAASVVAVASTGYMLLGASPQEWPTQTGCTSETHACTSGSCSRQTAVGEADAGMNMANVQGYAVRVCGTVARPLAGAGTLKNYHRIAATGETPEVTYNAQTVAYAGICEEFPPFVLPAKLPEADRMVWASSAVTITNWDGGTADVVTVTVCPNY